MTSDWRSVVRSYAITALWLALSLVGSMLAQVTRDDDDTYCWLLGLAVICGYIAGKRLFDAIEVSKRS
ncbi:hypothetical protein [Bradyrhizobium sp.]|uniref:hypothetical protein n=1 Tax=Bradyrhizobium sp. TaxID=376 RepID=UPI003C3D09D1